MTGVIMTDATLPLHRTRRVSLSKSQLRTELGAELLSLCQSITADGRLTPNEIELLRAWLADADAAELPAASYLREAIVRAVADGALSAAELRELTKAIETVLPPDVRQLAVTARRDADAADKAAGRAAEEAGLLRAQQEEEERRRNLPVVPPQKLKVRIRFRHPDGEAIATTSVTIAKHEEQDFDLVTEKQLAFLRELADWSTTTFPGGLESLRKWQASDLIDQLLSRREILGIKSHDGVSISGERTVSARHATDDAGLRGSGAYLIKFVLFASAVVGLVVYLLLTANS